MRLHTLLILSFVSFPLLADSLLHPPVGPQPNVCQNAYKAAMNPTTAAALVSTMQGFCNQKGGERVMYRELSPIFVVACMKRKQRKPLFICRYKSSFFQY